MRQVDAIYNQISGEIKDVPAEYEEGIKSGAFNALSKDQRDVLLNHYEARIGFYTMSNRFNKTVSTLWMNEHRALTNLSRLNSGEYPPYEDDFMIGLEEGKESNLDLAS